MRSLILGTGRALPSRVVTNDDLAALMDTSDDWIRARTGIQERRWIEAGDAGVGLGKQEALEALVYATSTPDRFTPGNGVYLQRELGITTTIPAIDLRMQCAGFIYALSIADGYIRTESFRRILVVGQEIQSTRMDLSTAGRHTAVIFADGAGAVVLGATEESGRGVLAFDLHTEGQHAEKLWVEGPGALVPPTEWAREQAEGRYWLRMDR